jgi:hypothetical protein
MKIEQGAKFEGLRLSKDYEVLRCRDTRPVFEGYERTSNRSKTTPAAVRYITRRLLSSDFSILVIILASLPDPGNASGSSGCHCQRDMRRRS